jgi:MFS family permease
MNSKYDEAALKNGTHSPQAPTCEHEFLNLEEKRPPPHDRTDGHDDANDRHTDVFVPPNGGLQAWLCVLAGFLIFVNVWGVVSSFGAFEAFYLRELLSNDSASAISWIGSVQAFLVVFVGIFAGPLFDRGFLRPLILLGSFLTVFGMFMLSLSTNFYQVFLSQALCVGLGQGLTYIPALALISSYFTTKRPIAIGVAAVGSSVGG